jgi:hypothetical protein
VPHPALMTFCWLVAAFMMVSRCGIGMETTREIEEGIFLTQREDVMLPPRRPRRERWWLPPGRGFSTATVRSDIVPCRYSKICRIQA